MKVVKEYWQCDICGQQYKQDGKLAKIKLPSRQFDCEGRSWSKGFCELDLCEDCLDVFWHMCDDLFATVNDCYGIEVTKHFKIEERENNE